MTCTTTPFTQAYSQARTRAERRSSNREDRVAHSVVRSADNLYPALVQKVGQEIQNFIQKKTNRCDVTPLRWMLKDEIIFKLDEIPQPEMSGSCGPIKIPRGFKDEVARRMLAMFNAADPYPGFKLERFYTCRKGDQWKITIDQNNMDGSSVQEMIQIHADAVERAQNNRAANNELYEQSRNNIVSAHIAPVQAALRTTLSDYLSKLDCAPADTFADSGMTAQIRLSNTPDFDLPVTERMDFITHGCRSWIMPKRMNEEVIKEMARQLSEDTSLMGLEVGYGFTKAKCQTFTSPAKPRKAYFYLHSEVC